MRLYEISQEFKALQNIAENECDFDAETGEVFDNSNILEQLFNELESKLEDKLDASAYITKELEQTAEALKDEARRLSARAANYVKNADRLKSLMLMALEASGEDKIKTLKWTFSTRKSESVEIDSLLTPEDLERKYTRIKREFDKTAIKNALKSGVEIEGASILVKLNLQIK